MLLNLLFQRFRTVPCLDKKSQWILYFSRGDLFMPRTARQKSGTGIYHVMLRGIGKQNIFEDDLDKDSFLKILLESKEKSGFQLYAYCLMNNHGTRREENFRRIRLCGVG